MKELLLVAIGSALVNNVVLSQFLGLCPFLGVSKKVETSAGMGAAVIFVITIASIVASLIYDGILVTFHLEYLQTIVFILVIAALVQFVEMFLKKSMPALYESLGVFLPLITTNCSERIQLRNQCCKWFRYSSWFYHRHRYAGWYPRKN